MGSFNLSSVMAKPMRIVGFAVGLILALAVTSAFLPDLKTYSGSISENLTTGTWGSALADSVSGIFALLPGLAILIGVVGIVLGAAVYGGGIGGRY